MISIYMVPASIALIVKIVMLRLLRPSYLTSKETTLFFLLLFTFSVQNIAEINSYLYVTSGQEIVSLTSGYIFFGATILALAFCYHLSLLITNGGVNIGPVRLILIYAPVALLEILLWFSPYLIEGFKPHKFTFTRVPGLLYPAFSVYAVLSMLAILWEVTQTAVNSKQPYSRRRKAKLFLVAISPTLLLGISVICLQHAGINIISTPVYLPLTLTFFLVVIGYAIFDTRIFHVAFKLPDKGLFSTKRTSFHRTVQNFAADLEGIPSTQVFVDKLSLALRCPVALLTERASYASLNGGQLARVPLPDLKAIKSITEINKADKDIPQTSGALSQYGLGAVVPCAGADNLTSGWLLFGDTLSNEDGSPLDFNALEDLLQQLAERALDNEAASQKQADKLAKTIIEAKQQIPDLEKRLKELEAENKRLKQHLNKEK